MGDTVTKLINEGDKIFLLKDGDRYTSRVLEIDQDKEQLLLEVPLYKLKRMYIQSNKSYHAEVFSDRHGVISFECVLKDYQKDFILIQLLKIKKKKQRRENFRLETVKPIEIFKDFDLEKIKRLKESNLSKLKNIETLLLDISLTGLSFIAKKKFSLNDKVIIKLNLNNDIVWVKVKIVNCREIEKEKFRVGVCFEKIEKKDKDTVNTFIIQEQIKYMKKRSNR